MADLQETGKRSAITKANSQAIISVSIASFISVFCLISSQTLWSQNAYLNKVTNQKEKANVQLEENIKAAESLSDSFDKFTSANPNAIKGDKNGNGDKDGDNAKLVLDALPSTYDFPALTSSLEKLLTSKNLKISGISGVDDQIAQQTAIASPNPQAVPMSFTIAVDNTSYDSIIELVNTLDTSIRPIQIDSITLEGQAASMRATITAHTFYQPPKVVNITTGVVAK